jgi:hypothetical protein
MRTFRVQVDNPPSRQTRGRAGRCRGRPAPPMCQRKSDPQTHVAAKELSADSCGSEGALRGLMWQRKSVEPCWAPPRPRANADSGAGAARRISRRGLSVRHESQPLATHHSTLAARPPRDVAPRDKTPHPRRETPLQCRPTRQNTPPSPRDPAPMSRHATQHPTLAVRPRSSVAPTSPGPSPPERAMGSA